MSSSVVHKSHCLIVVQLLLALYSPLEVSSQLTDDDRWHSLDGMPFDEVVRTSKDDRRNGIEYLEALKSRASAELMPESSRRFDDQEKQAKRTWGRNSMNVWGKRDRADKDGYWSQKDLDYSVGRMNDVLHAPARTPTSSDVKEPRRIAKRGWLPEHQAGREDHRWIEYNYLRRAKMAPQWGRNNMHVWG